jgi:hypothetical protein
MAPPQDELNDQQLDDAEDTGQQLQQVTVTQDRLGKLLTREQQKGERAAI